MGSIVFTNAMPPKKLRVPDPQSDEDETFEEDDPPSKKAKKKGEKPPKRTKESTKNAENISEKPADPAADSNEGVDDPEEDLFALVKKLPPKPDFHSRSNRKDRLMILNVEVNNFKSYSGKAFIGPFHKSFTSIIGPNGSGKSNLIDSLLFVFGFRASKIRSDKAASLIHDSVGCHPTSCTVTIHFQRIIDVPDHYIVVDGSQFDISRTVDKRGSSTYAINGRAASRNEVEACLRKVDIDIEHNRFLILQGEVETIAMMKPVKQTKSETGMVEYLEDIIGTNRIEPYINKFQLRVDRLSCEVSQNRVARDHARNSKISMEGSVRTAVEFLNKENEAIVISMKLEQRRRQQFLDKVAPLQAEADGKEAELKSLSEQLETNKIELKTAEEVEKKVLKDRSQIDSEIDEVTKILSDLSTEESRRKEKMKRLEDDIAKIEVEKEKEEKKKAGHLAAPEKAEKKIAKWKTEIAQLTEIEITANDAADKNLDEFEKRSEKIKEEQRVVQDKFAKLNADFNEVQSKVKVDGDELDYLKKAAQSGTAKLEELKARLVSDEDKNKKDKKELEVLKPQIDSMKDELGKLNGRLVEVRQEVKVTHREYTEQQETFEHLKARNTSSASTDKATKILTQEKEAGRIPSFIGKIGDMGVVNPKYEKAFGNNYAYYLKMFLCETDEDSGKVIDAFHEFRLPKASCRSEEILKKVDPKLFEPVPIERYGAPRLIDLVDCEPRMKQQYYDFLKETVVADTFAQARALNKTAQCRGVCIATLEGSMIYPNGSVCGGGKPQLGLILTDKNKKPKQVTAEDIAAQNDAEQKAQVLRAKVNRLREEEQRIDREIMGLRQKIDESTKRLKILIATTEADSSAIDSLRKTVERLQKESETVQIDEKEIEEKQQALDELKKKRDQLAKETETVQNVLKENQSKLDGFFNELVLCHREEAKNASKKRLKLEGDTAKESAIITSSARNAGKCDDNIARLEKDIQKNRSKCEELKENTVDPEVIEAKKAQLASIEERRKALEKELTDLTKKQSELSAAGTQIEDDQKCCKEKIDELKNLMAGNKIAVRDIEKKLQNLKLNRIPRFQFLGDVCRPEDVPMETEKLDLDENECPEEAEKRRKQIANQMTDEAYAKEFEQRQRDLESLESYANVDGDKYIPVELLNDEQVAEITKRDKEELVFKLKQCEQQIEALKSKVDLSCIDTYVTKIKEYNEQVMQLSTVTEEHRKHNQELQRLKQMRQEEFHVAFEFIGHHLVAVFKMLTDGGDAKLEYIDKDDPFKAGISFMVRPAKKAWKQIQFLSGGEKTLSSLALIFALHMFRPTPFYVMDEIDAALDYRNVSIIAQYVRHKTENAQFIIISLRNNMFELANRLVGIYKTNGRTKNVSIDPQKVCQLSKKLAEDLQILTCTLPEEISRRFNETVKRQHYALTAQEKQYPNFPSSSEISTAEKIVTVESRIRKEFPEAVSRANSNATNSRNLQSSAMVPESNQASSSRPGRSVSQISTRSPRKRTTESDEITPPAKRSNSTPLTRSQRRGNASAEKNASVAADNEKE